MKEKNYRLRIAICDDNEPFCKMMDVRLSKLRPKYDIDLFNTGELLLSSSIEYDIIFLDIKMPNKDGIDVGIELREKHVDSHIIYLTGCEDYTKEAIKVKAHRYLMKGCSLEELLEALCSAENEIFEDKKVYIEENGYVICVNKKNISCVEAYGDGVYVYLEDKIIESKKTLTYWTEKLGQEFFFRVSRSYLISYEHICYYKDKQIKVSYKNDIITLPRRKVKEFEGKRDEFVNRHFVKI